MAILILKYKGDGSRRQVAAVEEAIRTTQFIRNKQNASGDLASPASSKWRRGKSGR